jgi:hypothetical protein
MVSTDNFDFVFAFIDGDPDDQVSKEDAICFSTLVFCPTGTNYSTAATYVATYIHI